MSSRPGKGNIRHSTHLRVVHPQCLPFRAHTQSHARNHVDRLRKKRGDDEGVADRSADVRELYVELLPMPVYPPAWDGGDAVKGDKRLVGEECVEEEADDTADRVLCEQICDNV